MVDEGQVGRLTPGDRRLALLFTIISLAVTLAASLQPVYFGPPPNRLLILPGLTWGLLGVALTWRARSRRTVAMAVIVFTLPAVIALLLAPGIMLILQNLG